MPKTNDAQKPGRKHHLLPLILIIIGIGFACALLAKHQFDWTQLNIRQRSNLIKSGLFLLACLLAAGLYVHKQKKSHK